MASMVASRPLAALPSSRCAAPRPQALQASSAPACSLDPQAGAAPGLPCSKGCDEVTACTREESADRHQLT